jgi:hypothetical protein
MRKRSAATGQGPTGQQELGGQGKRSDHDYWKCGACGTKQGRNALEAGGGKCVRCDAPVGTAGGPPDGNALADHEREKAEPDPWALDPSKDAQRAAPAAPPPPGGVSRETPPAAAPPAAPIPEEQAIGTLVAMLAKAGVEATVVEVAAMEVEDRRVAWRWAKAFDRGPMPDCVRALVREMRPEEGKIAAGTGTLTSSAGIVSAASSPPVGSFAPKAGIELSSAPVLNLGDAPLDRERREVLAARDLGEEVTYAWGEEKLTLVKDSYSTTTVGSFSSTTRVRAGETRAAAFERLRAEVTAVAEAERERKIASFLRAFNAGRAQAKG